MRNFIKKLLPWRRSDYYSSPRDYWEQRHARNEESLIGVGHVGMTEDANVGDYEAKWKHIGPFFAAAKEEGRRSLLDAGCGNGWFTKKWVEMGFEVSCVDFSASAIGQARRLVENKVKAHISPLHQFAPNRTFDIVASIDVLFHIVDDTIFEQTLCNFTALVAPRGLIVIQDHLISSSEGTITRSHSHPHCHWRSLAHYTAILGHDWVADQYTYLLPNERVHKDLLLFSRKSAA